MAYYSAFQSNAFQNNSFQIKTGESAGQQNGAGFPAWDSTGFLRGYDKRPVSERVQERIEQLPDSVQDAIEQAVNLPSKSERTTSMMLQLESVERKFQLLYIALMEQYRDAWIDEQLQLELAAKYQQQLARVAGRSPRR